VTRYGCQWGGIQCWLMLRITDQVTDQVTDQDKRTTARLVF